MLRTNERTSLYLLHMPSKLPCACFVQPSTLQYLGFAPWRWQSPCDLMMRVHPEARQKRRLCLGRCGVSLGATTATAAADVGMAPRFFISVAVCVCVRMMVSKNGECLAGNALLWTMHKSRNRNEPARRDSFSCCNYNNDKRGKTNDSLAVLLQ
jgi:hypothetical protein